MRGGGDVLVCVFPSVDTEEGDKLANDGILILGQGRGSG